MTDTPKPLLVADALDVIFDTYRGPHQVLHQVSFQIAPGEILGVVGESGAGKSMTGLAVAGLIEAPGRLAHGSVMLEGVRIDTLQGEAIRRLRGRRIGMVFQDPLTSLNPVLTIGQQLTETIRTHLPLSEGQATERALALLAEVEIPQPEWRLSQYPHQLSGGMRQRVAIALALCADPCLLIADEPTTALDVSVQAQIIALLRRLCRQRGLSAMLITHDMGVIAETADRVMVMYGGRVLETGPVRQVLQHPRHRYTRALMAAIPSVTRRQHRLPVPGVEPSSSVLDDGNVPQSLSVVDDGAPQWQAQPPKAVESASAADQSAEADAGTPLLSVENLSRRFDLSSGWLQRLLSREPRRILQAVDNVGFTITRGRTFGLVGESGSGKSTVARMVAGLLKPDSGRIVFEGIDRWSRDAARLPTEQRLALRRRCQMIFQDPYASLNPRWRVARLIAEPLHVLGLATDRDEIEARVTDMLRHVRMSPDDARKYPHQFSGGQRQRIAIARALISQPDFIICDEPTSALDVSVQAQVLNLMRDLQDEYGLTYLLISHDLAVIRFMCDDIGVMQQGRMVEQGRAQAVLDDPQDPYTRQLLAAIPSLDV
ncbi:ABC transporter ATP-binding protein [Lautropia mirabilis]|uniref:ABC transporter ATP-binding protein n=1 Tax=Lautropia mirabilis TaxID=47671 RepID=UPI0028F0FD17|nr:ABC transporter ATP-binding protein [Lautropia mirabilis]